MRLSEPGFLEAYGAAWSAGSEEELAAYFADDVEYVEGAVGVTYRGIAELASLRIFTVTTPARPVRLSGRAPLCGGTPCRWEATSMGVVFSCDLPRRAVGTDAAPVTRREAVPPGSVRKVLSP
jgi:hypothetical protein